VPTPCLFPPGGADETAHERRPPSPSTPRARACTWRSRTWRSAAPGTCWAGAVRHIAGVGFDLYVRMIGEAVAELRDSGRPSGPGPGGAAGQRPFRTSTCPAGLRLEAYTRIAAVDSTATSLRYTPGSPTGTGPPEPVLSLLAVARLRSRRAGPADRHHPAGHPHPVLAGGAARLGGSGGAAVPNRAGRRCVPCSCRCPGPARRPALPPAPPIAAAAARPGLSPGARLVAVFGEDRPAAGPTLEKGRRGAPHLITVTAGALAALALTACGGPADGIGSRGKRGFLLAADQ
jgi:hypothetical protein